MELNVVIILGLLVAITSCLEKPNIVILFADDLGWGDLGCYGHPTSTSPNLDKMAAEGLKFMNFYSTSPICSPSRASLLTGRYQVRTGMYPGALECGSIGGLPWNETTIAAQLKQAGYGTAIVGKWHLGVGREQQYLPTNYGFDYFLGLPYSHDMCPCYVCFYPQEACYDDCRPESTPCPLYENDKIIQQPADFLKLSETYSSAATGFIHQMAAKKKPFFLYMAFQHTHHPQFSSKMFTNSSIRGTFGDSLNEMDWQVGKIFDAIHGAGIAKNTFVFFTSDNGPSLFRGVRGGSAGPFRCGKGTTYEGGVRMPAIAWWPGRIAPGVTSELTATLDLFPTISNLVNIAVPTDRVIDGIDMSTVLFANTEGGRESLMYYPPNPTPSQGVFAIRYKEYKAHYYTAGTGLYPKYYPDPACNYTKNATHYDPPLLFNLNQDPGELNPLNTSGFPYKEIVDTINQIKIKFEAAVTWAEPEISKGVSNDSKPCAKPGCTPFPQCCTTNDIVPGTTRIIHPGLL
ncbi:arylsulfatase A-like [Dysidea avara]|uniref:arylsulfatase A-like n=1 Tax=Dysidea avara TaxID=196820 RepID=UPI003325B9E1